MGVLQVASRRAPGDFPRISSWRGERRLIANEKQPRRNEEGEDFFGSFFAFFVSSWLFFLNG